MIGYTYIVLLDLITFSTLIIFGCTSVSTMFRGQYLTPFAHMAEALQNLGLTVIYVELILDPF